MSLVARHIASVFEYFFGFNRLIFSFWRERLQCCLVGRMSLRWQRSSSWRPLHWGHCIEFSCNFLYWMLLSDIKSLCRNCVCHNRRVNIMRHHKFLEHIERNIRRDMCCRYIFSLGPNRNEEDAEEEQRNLAQWNITKQRGEGVY